MFWTFPLLTEEDMASCSRAFRKPNNAEEVRKLIENATPKLTRAATEWSLKIFREWPNDRKNKNPVIEPRAFTINECSDFILAFLLNTNEDEIFI